ncbi:hypothetical protein CL619_01790 [archaeon]|nr:hypothetical protein [archaeon]|tara:strand:- start:1693 stop:2100 length:408 start_codon:yes stop_codon:yes gene_type:complete
MNTAIAVKAFIVNESKEILVLQRRTDDVHAAGRWDIPGGRLDTGENPFTGLSREVIEEAALDIEIIAPLQINYFTRDDGQIITMLLFLCHAKSFEVQISEEHNQFKWIPLQSVREFLGPEFHDTIEAYEKNFVKE